MSLKSLGLIETYGLLAGVVAADTAVKSANVTLVGYEFAKGSGMTTIKVEGDVGAVKAAISAAQVAAEKVGRVASTRVIPRPSQYLEVMVRNGDTVGYEKPAPAPEPEPPAPSEPPEAPVPPKAPAPKHSGKKSGKPLPKEAKAPAPEAVKGEAEAAAEPQGEKKD